MNLCVECFCVGVEPHPHQACHAYHVVDDLSFPLFTLDWGADEDQLLLEAIEMYGLGNWSEVAEHVGAKTKAQCHKHYFDVYVHSPTAPLPDMSKVLGKAYERVSEEDEKDSKPKKAKHVSNKTMARMTTRTRMTRGPAGDDGFGVVRGPGDERHSGNVPSSP